MTPETSEVWSIGVVTGGELHDLAAGVPSRPLLTAAEVDDVDAGFVADPFLLCRGGRWFLFFGVWNRTADKGEIALAESPDLATWTYRGIVLREPWHLSYPHVFEHGGEVWMLPETLESGSIRLYRAVAFPASWTLHAELLPGAFADPTPLLWHERWYLFACPRPYSHDALSLFVADRLDGGWREHPSSPLHVADPRRSRPAGRIVVTGGRPLRWAQDCHPRYGTAVRGFEILALDEGRYEEREILPSPLLGPGRAGWNRDGMHHLDAHRVEDGARNGGGARWVAAVDGVRVVTAEKP